MHCMQAIQADWQHIALQTADFNKPLKDDIFSQYRHQWQNNSVRVEAVSLMQIYCEGAVNNLRNHAGHTQTIKPHKDSEAYIN